MQDQIIHVLKACVRQGDIRKSKTSVALHLGQSGGGVWDCQRLVTCLPARGHIEVGLRLWSCRVSCFGVSAHL
jgi:hypothetical protein